MSSPCACVSTNLDDLASSVSDWTGRWGVRYRDTLRRRLEEEKEGGSGQEELGGMILRPSSVEQASAALRLCHDRCIGPVIPRGGNTGLVGGSAPTEEKEDDLPVILCGSRLRAVHGFDRTDGTLRAQAGCTLLHLQDLAAEHEHLVPLDLGSAGSCQIGGNLATNAGGSYYYRYGSLRANVLGLRAVGGDGTIYDCGSGASPSSPRPLRKDNTGYDLTSLFIGSEGTLGFITDVAISCYRAPKSRISMMLSCRQYNTVLEIMATAKGILCEVLAAFELMDGTVVRVLRDREHMNFPPILSSFDEEDRFVLLVETHGADATHDREKVDNFLEACMHIKDGDKGDVGVLGALAQNDMQAAHFWALRERCNPAAASLGHVYKYDLSLAAGQFDELVGDVRGLLKERGVDAIVMSWGHVGDGNVHLNVVTPGEKDRNESIVNILEPYVYDIVVEKYAGSISAEHGVGQCKHLYLAGMKDKQDMLERMAAVKGVFDPRWILNRGKVHICKGE